MRHRHHIFDTEQGLFLDIATDDVRAGMDEYVMLYRTHIGDDISKQFAHLLQGNGLDRLPQYWLLSSHSPSGEDRAKCIIELGQVFGFEVIDDDPDLLSQSELELRWSLRTPEGPCTSVGNFHPATLVPELYKALYRASSSQYWRLFDGPFPLVPMAAVEDKDHPWWALHGVQAVNKLVHALQGTCPEGTVFEVRAEQFGFWKTVNG